jgi:two-component system, LytTR family, response regulator
MKASLQTAQTHEPLLRKLECVLVSRDTNTIAQTERHIDHIDFIRLSSILSSNTKAIEHITKQCPDVVFIDTDLDNTEALAINASTGPQPVVILITDESNGREAMEALQPVDYLLKPLTFARFGRAAMKAYEVLEKRQSTTMPTLFFIKTNTRILGIALGDLYWIEAFGDYVDLHTAQGKYTVHATMKALDSQLSPQGFIRVHRSYIVNASYVEQLKENSLQVLGAFIPLGKSYKPALLQRLSPL